LGGSNYRGELVDKFFETRGTFFAPGVLVRYNPTERISFKITGVYGHVAGDDKWYEKDAVRTKRNLDFKSVLWDFSAGLDINLATISPREEKGIIPYVSMGISVFKFNPTTQFIFDPNSPHALRSPVTYSALRDFDGKWVELQPLGTEGQQTTQYNERRRYALTQLAIPLAAGLKIKINKQWTIGLEYGLRKTFTDYLDDVSSTYVEPEYVEGQYGIMASSLSDRSATLNEPSSPRGDKSNKDTYSLFGFSLTYRIFTNRVRCFQF
jgi:hypothetical protein